MYVQQKWFLSSIGTHSSAEVLSKSGWKSMFWLYKYRIATLVHKSFHETSQLNELFT